MLDLGSVKRQIDAMVLGRTINQSDYADRVTLAVREWKRWEDDMDTLADKVAKARTSWMAGRPIEDIGTVNELPSRPEKVSVIATDGSQIFPDRNEVASCFLINLGFVVMTYGTVERPVMDSEPRLFYEDEDLYQDRAGRRSLITREQVGHKRSGMEFAKLTELAETCKDHPAVAMCDGTLILWMLEGKPLDLRRSMLRSFLSALDRLACLEVPVCGYISDPAGSDVIKALRVGMCPEISTDCDRCPWMSGSQEQLPCDPIEGVTDAALFWQILKPGERSRLFESASKILDDYGSHRIAFFYIHTGQEIGRVEVPMWVAKENALLDRIHSTVMDQCSKGRGYPVVLSESHEQAVVRSADRETFYTLLRDAFVKSRISARISTKQLNKNVVEV